MPRQYIDFISAYCDRWCERCAFTERCSQFAVSVAQTMCGGASIDYSVAVHRWLDARGGADSIAEALAVVRWDVYLIAAKIHRALEGRDQDPRGRFWGSRVQNDWNGSAKVAGISVDRSERAWRSIAAGSGDDGAMALADLLAAVRQHLDREFPHAMQFRRPGFDG